MAKNQLAFAAIQMSMRLGDKESNITKAEKMIDQAVKKHNPDIIGLPEFFSTEFFPQWMDRKFFKEAEPIPGSTTNRIASKAKEHGIYIIAPIYEKAARGLYYDSSPLIAPDGKIIGVSRKIELPNVWFREGDAWANEAFYYASSNIENAYAVYETKIGNLGQIICWNRHFPETWRRLTVKGADMVFVPVASMGKFLGEMFSMEMRVMAYQHQCFAVVVNRVGIEGDQKFYGGSHIVGPKGELLAGPASDTREEIICANLNLDDVDEARQRLPFTRDFYTDTIKVQAVYGEILKQGQLAATAEPSGYGKFKT